MRAGRTVLFGLGALAAMLVGGLWAAPALLDVNRYKENIASLVAAGLGRPVRIGGNVTLHLLPQPILTASGIEVADSGGGVTLTARELRLRVALGTLLAGRVDARELTLRGAEIRLPWPPPPGALAQRPPAWITGLQARLEDSRLFVGNLLLSGIDASLATDPDTGTLSAAGVAQLSGRSWRFTARLARPGRDGAAGLEVSLDGQGPLRDTGGTFSGALAADGALSGRVAGRGPDLSQLMPAPAVPWRGDGRLNAAAGLAVADELALEIGGSPARGAVALRVQPEARLDLALAAGRLDLDAWLPVLVHGGATGGSGIPTGIDLSAEAASLAGGTLRHLRGAFDLDAGGVAVRDATALLPGDAQLAVSGRISRGQAAVFDGAARLAAPDLRTTLRWLEPLAPRLLGALPQGVLRTAELTASVKADAAQATLSGLSGRLDGSRVAGSLGVRATPRPAVTIAAELERLVLDPWLPDPDALAQPGTVPDLVARLAAADAELKLHAAAATYRGAPVGAVTLDAQAEAGRLTLRRLEAAPWGIRIAAAGSLAEGRVTDARLDLSTQDATPLRALLPLPAAPVAPLLRGAGTATILASGPAEALAARLTIELGDLRIDLQPVLNLPARRWAGPLMLHHPGAPRVLETLGLGGTAAWLGDGSLSLLAQLVVAPRRLELEGLDLAAGGLRAGGRLVLDGHALSGQLAAETLPLPIPYPGSPDPIPVAALRGWEAAVHVDAGQVLLGQTPVLRDAGADVSLRNGRLHVRGLTGRQSGGMVTGAATLDAAADPPRLSVQGKAAGIVLSGPVFGTPLDLVSGLLDAELDLSGAGHSPGALLATLAGSATLAVRDGAAAGFDLPGVAAALAGTDRSRTLEQVRAALAGGVTPFARLDMPVKAQRGVLSVSGTLQSPDGVATLAGSLALSGALADARVDLRAAGDAPGVAVQFTGPVFQPARTPELAGLARWLAERPTN